MKQKFTRKVNLLLLSLALGCGTTFTSGNAHAAAPLPEIATMTAANDAEANEAAYKRLSAEIDDIQATYDLVYNEYIALAQINGSGWAASFGNRLGGIQSGINAMKATLGGLYAQGTLTEETTLASIYEQYETIVGDLNALKAQFEQTIAGQVNQILYDLNMVTASQMAGLIGNLQNQLNEYGVAEQYADRVNVLLQKKAEAAQKVADCQAAIAATTNYVERLTAAKNAKTEVYAILEEINTEIEAILAEAKQSEGGQQAINKQAYDRLSAEIDDIQATYDLVYNEYIALAQINGSGWAASFGNRLGGIQSGINAMKATLGGLYAQGTLTEETTLASIYEQYETIVGDLNTLKAQFEQTIAGQVNQILYDLNMVTASQMAGLIGNLQNQLNEYGVAEQYADRVNVLLQKKADAAQKVADCQAAIAATTDYLERLTAAKNAKTEVYAILEEINTEIEAILAEAKQSEGGQQAINKQAYDRLSAEIDDIQATYDLVYNEYIALAQINGSGWAASFGNRLGGIQSGINAMKATLGGLYAQGTLTEETTLASIYEQYETIVGDLNALKAQFEQTIAGQVNQILYDLNMVTASQMGGLIGNLQNQLNEWGVAEKYADRVNVLLQKKADAAQKVADCQMAIAATTNYVERLTAAKNAKTEVYTILEEINTEIEAILAEANPATGITAIKAGQFTNKQIYNMSGVRVNTPGKGLYIINGKKVIIK